MGAVTLRRISGTVPSLNTPFHADGALDLAGLEREVEHVVAAGCAGILALAVAGEGLSLNEKEFAAAATTIVDANGGRVPVIVSVTAAADGAMRQRAAATKAAGADAILYQPPPEAGADRLRAQMTELADIGPGPIMLQDLDWHGPGLPVPEIVALHKEIDAFQSLKIETVPAGPKYGAVIGATDGKLHVCGGWAVAQMLDALARGVHAFMPTELEPVYVAIYDLFQAGEIERARDLFDATLPVIAFANQHIDVSIRFFKYLRQRAGLFSTATCRPPVPDLDPQQWREAERLAGYVPTLLLAEAEQLRAAGGL